MLVMFDEICKKESLTYYMFGGTLLGAVRHKGFIPWDNDVDVAMPRNDFEKLKRRISKHLPEHIEIQTYETDPACYSLLLRVRNMNTVCELEGSTFAGSKYNGAFIDVFPLDNASKESSIGNTVRSFLIRKVVKPLAVRSGENNRENKSIKQKLGNLIAGILPREKWCKLDDRIAKGFDNSSAPYCINLGSHYSHKKQVFLKDKLNPPAQAEFEGHMFNVPKDCHYVLKKFYGENYMKMPSMEERHMEDHVILKLEIGDEEK